MERKVEILYDRMHKAGIKTLKTGRITPYKLSPESLQNQTTTALLFQQDSIEEAEKKIGAHINAYQEDYSSECGMIVANRDYRLHSTLLIGSPYNSTINHEGYIPSLVGVTIKFDWVISDKANLLIASSNIPKEVTASRNILKDIYNSAGVVFPQREIDILHCTYCRLTSAVPRSISYCYAFLGESLRLKLITEPLELIVETVATIRAADMLLSNRKHPV